MYDWEQDVRKITHARQITKMGVTELRNLISKLVIHLFFPHYNGQKPRGIWRSKKPDGWPPQIPFQDPNNKIKGSNKPKKPMLVTMLEFLVKSYRTQNGLAFDSFSAPMQPHGHVDDVSESIESQPHIDHRTIPSQTRVQPSQEVSSAEIDALNVAQMAISPQNQRCVKSSPQNQRCVKSFNRIQESAQSALKDPNSHVDKNLAEILVDLLSESQNTDKKTMKTLHNIEYYLALEPDEVDEHDTNQFKINLNILKNHFCDQRSLANMWPSDETLKAGKLIDDAVPSEECCDQVLKANGVNLDDIFLSNESNAAQASTGNTDVTKFIFTSPLNPNAHRDEFTICQTTHPHTQAIIDANNVANPVSHNIFSLCKEEQEQGFPQCANETDGASIQLFSDDLSELMSSQYEMTNDYTLTQLLHSFEAASLDSNAFQTSTQPQNAGFDFEPSGQPQSAGPIACTEDNPNSPTYTWANGDQTDFFSTSNVIPTMVMDFTEHQ